MNPYNVLGVSENSTDEEVKKAYRDLAKKYHPDNYKDNPLADLASEKMRSINEAYDMIVKNKNTSNNTGRNYTGNYSNANSSANSSIYTQIRNAISVSNIGLAETMLSKITNKDAEWYFLSGCIAYKKGWFDEALRQYQTACSMDPNNLEYRTSQQRLVNMSVGGQTRRGGSNIGCCSQLICADCCCECCGGDLISCC